MRCVFRIRMDFLNAYENICYRYATVSPLNWRHTWKINCILLFLGLVLVPK